MSKKKYSLTPNGKNVKNEFGFHHVDSEGKTVEKSLYSMLEMLWKNVSSKTGFSEIYNQKSISINDQF